MACALVVAASGGAAFLVGRVAFSRLRRQDVPAAGEVFRSSAMCSASGLRTAESNRSDTAKVETSTMARATSGLPAVAQEESGDRASVGSLTAFQQLALADAGVALRLRNGLSTATAKEIDTIRSCLGRTALPVSTFVEVTWRVRSNGDRLSATDGHFERVRRGAVLSRDVLDCMSAISFSDYAFTVPALALPPGFDSPMAATFLLAVD